MPNLIDIAKPLISLPFKVVSAAAGQAEGLIRRLRGGDSAENVRYSPAQATASPASPASPARPEPTPAELAARGEGRQPAPFGNTTG
jgi:hypothetical protein